MWVPGFCHAENFVYAAEIPYKQQLVNFTPLKELSSGFHLELEIICIIEKFSKDSSYIAMISSETS